MQSNVLYIETYQITGHVSFLGSSNKGLPDPSSESDYRSFFRGGVL